MAQLLEHGFEGEGIRGWILGLSHLGLRRTQLLEHGFEGALYHPEMRNGPAFNYPTHTPPCCDTYLGAAGLS